MRYYTKEQFLDVLQLVLQSSIRPHSLHVSQVAVGVFITHCDAALLLPASCGPVDGQIYIPKIFQSLNNTSHRLGRL